MRFDNLMAITSVISKFWFYGRGQCKWPLSDQIPELCQFHCFYSVRFADHCGSLPRYQWYILVHQLGCSIRDRDPFRFQESANPCIVRWPAHQLSMSCCKLQKCAIWSRLFPGNKSVAKSPQQSKHHLRKVVAAWRIRPRLVLKITFVTPVDLLRQRDRINKYADKKISCHRT